jgi:hypothetical protein
MDLVAKGITNYAKKKTLVTGLSLEQWYSN